MIDMSTWEDLAVDVVDDLHLDPDNVRLDLQRESIPEADIIHDLFANEKAFSLVEGIVKVGYLTHEVPIVIDREGKLFVVEGNRRVAALKAIQNPYLAPDHQARITKLAQELADRSALRQIRVKRAPNQDDANQLIAALHTGNQRLPWAPQRQAAFFQAQIDAGKTPEQLIAQYPTIDVKKFVVRSKILDLFRQVDYKDSSLKDYIGRRRGFPVSTLARLYDNAKFLQLAQIEVDDEEASVILRAKPRYFRKLAEKIVADIKSNRINTRVLNSTKSDSYRDFMDELRELRDQDDAEPEETAPEAPPASTVPPTTAPSQGTAKAVPAKASAASSTAGTVSPPPSSTPTPAAAPVAKKQDRKYLKTENLEVPAGFPPPIEMIFKELSEINVNRFPNATLDLIRSFLEKSIKAYAEAQGVDIRQSVQTQGGFVQLSHCLDWLDHQITASKLPTAFKQPIKKIRSGKIGDYIMTQDHLNAINHNHHVFATADEVRTSWAVIEGLLKVIFKP